MKTVPLLKVLVPIFLLILSGCSGKKESTAGPVVLDLPTLLEHKGDDIRISDLVDSVGFVTLQPVSEWGFPQFVLQSKLLDHYILFKEKYERVVIYRKSGEFVVNLFKRGKGPGEYNAIEDYGMDPSETKIWLLEGYAAKLHWYDLTGNWIETVKLPTKVSYVYMLPDGKMLALNQRWEPDAYDSTRLFLCGADGHFIRSVWDKPKSIPDYSNFLDYNWIIQHKGDYYFRDNPNADTLYKLDKNFTPHPFLVMDPGKYGPPKELLEDTRRYNEISNYLRVSFFYPIGNQWILTGHFKNGFMIDFDTGTGQSSFFGGQTTNDLLGILHGLQGRSIHSDYYYATIYVPYYREHLDKFFVNDHPVYPELQEKLRRTLAEAPEDLDMVVVYYKPKGSI
jgi:hypothetical protein